MTGLAGRGLLLGRQGFPRLYAIIDAESAAGRSVEEMVKALLAAGVRCFQYRDKRGSSRHILETVERLLEMVRREGGVLIVNDRADVALVAGADGVHLGQKDLAPHLARRVLKTWQRVGASTHTVEQVRRADESSADYIAFGPIFPTTSKNAPDPVVGLEGLALARQATAKPLVAIGGITVGNAGRVIEQGADAVAVIAGLLAAADLEAQAREFLKVLADGD